MIVSVHSFRGGTGKSNISANLASLLAMAGQRVGVIDTDIQSPGIHVLFGVDANQLTHSLNDYLYGRCDITEAAQDLSSVLGPDLAGAIYLIPASLNAGDIARVLREGYDTSLLSEGLHRLVDELRLDALIIDTHPGLNEETLLSIAISDALVIVLRPDQQDYEGTGVTVQVARKLEVPRMLLVVNKKPDAFDAADVRAQVERAYSCEVAAVLPHSDDMMVLASKDIFVRRFPDHPVTDSLRSIPTQLGVPT
jgi:MinD-like ATPase involved in chromosome partitioning or flagellar assembly